MVRTSNSQVPVPSMASTMRNPSLCKFIDRITLEITKYKIEKREMIHGALGLWNEYTITKTKRIIYHAPTYVL